MSAMTAETCANCGTAIGRLEAAHVFQDHVVCAACLAKLQPQPHPLGYSAPVQNLPPQQPILTPAGSAQVVVQLPPQRKWVPGVAALLSFLIPGAGQIYKGDVLNGLLWLAIVTIGYFLMVIPGVVAHIACIFVAANGDPYK